MNIQIYIFTQTKPFHFDTLQDGSLKRPRCSWTFTKKERSVAVCQEDIQMQRYHFLSGGNNPSVHFDIQISLFKEPEELLIIVKML